MHNYRFAGNYAINIGEIPTDLAYWNAATGHFDDIYQFTFTDQDNYLYGIWNYGYKVVDNSARAIKAAKNLYGASSEEDKVTLDIAMGEAYALRGYANLLMVNVYGHQIKVDGQDFSSQPGLVISEEPIAAFQEVERSTVGQTYDAIVSDFKASLEHFAAAGGDQEQAVYFTKAAVEGLLARTYLYMENYDEAYSYAQKALADANITSLTTTAAEYKALYNTTVQTKRVYSIWQLMQRIISQQTLMVPCGLRMAIFLAQNCVRCMELMIAVLQYSIIVQQMVLSISRVVSSLISSQAMLLMLQTIW